MIIKIIFEETILTGISGGVKEQTRAAYFKRGINADESRKGRQNTAVDARTSARTTARNSARTISPFNNMVKNYMSMYLFLACLYEDTRDVPITNYTDFQNQQKTLEWYNWIQVLATKYCPEYLPANYNRYIDENIKYMILWCIKLKSFPPEGEGWKSAKHKGFIIVKRWCWPDIIMK